MPEYSEEFDDQFVVATGNPFDGLSLWGPFETREDANDFAEHEDWDDYWWIINVNHPDRALDVWELKAKRAGVDYFAGIVGNHTSYTFFRKGADEHGVPALQYNVLYVGPTGNRWDVYRIEDGDRRKHCSGMGLWEAFDLVIELVEENS
jgi:hypothetical protein